MFKARPFALLSVAALALAACGQDPAPAETPAASGAATPAASPGTPPANTANLWNGGQSSPLDIQVAHPNGVVLQLTSLQSRPTETVVGVRVINGRDREVQLNRFNNNRDGYIVVDSGERIYLSPPGNNARLAIQAGQTLEGELVFLGRLPAGQSAILVLNENAQTDNQHTNQPGFRIDLPLQATGQ
ncbi:hypothetical protein E4M02_01280 [Brevundimonas sp. S30B]|uniref:hypothetical protein n=1 Tax=unclassified Brevundimonas TaxID=2622653 RepID=UPI0010716D48|nr:MULTISPECIES: hypothetical protein [unclassified Brevundimonas]QBX37455.1 hypothetical protein E4M01_06540 [Brevundimonas sp. MF30-B]TFW03752.1 hypothetical protein E4M02_01280 [Brevundimonas sp. S30B]